MKAPVIIGIVFCIVGVILLGIGFGHFSNTQKLLSNSEEVEGTIIEIKEELPEAELNTNRRIYTPVFRFQLKDSSEYVTVESQESQGDAYVMGELKKPFTLNQEVTILYERGNPNNAKVKSFVALWCLPLVLGVLGIIFMPLGLFVALAAYKET